MARLSALTVCLFSTSLLLNAQQDRIATIDRTRSVELRGFVPVKARAEFDRGSVDPDFAMDGIAIHFKLSQAKQIELEQLLHDQQDRTSSSYHKWLTPEQYGSRFGLSSGDVRKVTDWLRSEGFAIGHVGRGRSYIMFSGSANQVTRAFRTPVHRFEYGGQAHFSNTAEPSVPMALRDIVSGIDGLNDFVPESHVRLGPETTTGSAHTLAPDDLATIYDVKNLYQAGIDGTGQKLAIVGQSEINLDDTRAFRSRYNLPANDPVVILVPNTTSPGVTSFSTEANLDVQWSGAMARNATIIYVYSRSVLTSLLYAVDQNLAPVVSESFGGCEQQSLGIVGAWRQVAMQANSQGITWVNATGDAGAAGCDSSDVLIAQNGLSVSFPANIPEVTAVGGTQFNEGSGTYWNTTNDENGASARSYIPETVWNEVAIVHGVAAGGGGASKFFPKPVWQTGPGVPNDGMRDTPDVALASGVNHDGFNITTIGRNIVVGGTSASTPLFAGMLALLNHYLTSNNHQAQTGLGNINPALYALAQSNPTAFHDITDGGNAVPCAAGSPDCGSPSIGFSAGPGYDQASGLGSVDLYNLVQAWNTAAPAQTVIDFGISANPVYQLATPDAAGFSWEYVLTVADEAGVSSTLTDLIIDGTSYASQLTSFFKSTNLPAKGFLSASLGARGLTAPAARIFELRGMDANGNAWSQKLNVKFLGPAPVPSIAGAANAASFTQSFAPGMLVSVFGTDLTTTAPQLAAVVPLTTYLGNFNAAINGVAAPIQYVSPQQVNIQIPYETQAGNATLTLSNGLQTATYMMQIADAAPGIFAGGDGFTVPYGSGSRGKTYTLFITGAGQVTPAVATGTPPSLLTPVTSLPKPNLPVAMSIGGVDTPIAFAGIPYGLVGVVQINFTVPDNAPLGKQQVIVNVGSVASAPANFTVTQ